MKKRKFKTKKKKNNRENDLYYQGDNTDNKDTTIGKEKKIAIRNEIEKKKKKRNEIKKMDERLQDELEESSEENAFQKLSSIFGINRDVDEENLEIVSQRVDIKIPVFDDRKIKEPTNKKSKPEKKKEKIEKIVNQNEVIEENENILEVEEEQIEDDESIEDEKNEFAKKFK